MADDALHDPGGKTHMALLPGVIGMAQFAGPLDRHRISLGRRWGKFPYQDKPYALWIGMNPSMATAEQDDLTVRKEQTWTRMTWGLERYIKCNVASYRSTDPAGLATAIGGVNHPENLPAVMAFAKAAQVVVLTTGQVPEILEPHARTLFRALKAAGLKPLCLGVTKSGWPKHSSRIGYDTPFVEFAL